MAAKKKIIGLRIKEQREILNMTQKQLCEGICSQAHLSRIEHGSTYPTTYIVEKIANRINVDINRLLGDVTLYQNHYIEQFNIEVQKSLAKSDYEDVALIIKREENNPIFFSGENLRVFLRYKAIIMYFYYKNPDESLNIINKVLLIDQPENSYNYLDIEIKSLKANIIFNQGDIKQSINIYEDIMESIKNMEKINYGKLYNRITYNYSRILFAFKDYNKSLTICLKGISYSKNIFSMYYLDHLYHLKAEIHWKLNEKNLCKRSLKLAYSFAEVLDNEQILSKVKKSLDNFFNNN
ncbi:helix-turn-helix domain-containing protein [Bacillus sp. SM2101]|uniref:helix-turn-helix domain-containing protein n=1 Tax=Bacillus sp. SM2101 TaxID=2805366 RepID=UPI001BDE0695|nr:helix-turn-helix domain-containing protein [Bacillus sp. SM2101]